MRVPEKTLSPARVERPCMSEAQVNSMLRTNVSAACVKVTMWFSVAVHVPAKSASKTGFDPDAATWRWPVVVPFAARVIVSVLPAAISFL